MPPVAMTTALGAEARAGPDGSDGEHAAHRVVLDDEAPRLEAFEDVDRGRRARRRDEGAHDFAPGAVAAGMGDPPPRVRGLQAEREAAVSRPVETRRRAARGFRSPRARRAVKQLDDRGVAEPVAGGDRVGGVQRRRVVGARAPPPCRPAPSGSSLPRRAAPCEQDDRAWRERQRGHQPGDARADDDDAPAQRAQVRRSQRQHPLDGAARRRGDRRIDRDFVLHRLQRAADLGAA